jgi:hypothetical protein
MIEKERLEELIEQEATIWAVYDEDRMERIKLVVRMMGVSVEEYNKIHNCEPMLYSQFCGIVKDICPISWLFETEEDAKWFAEFGCIERTERLELPTWEEFIEMEEVCFWKKNHRQTVIRVLGTKYIAVETSYERFFIGDLTKESYIKACRKAKELFLKGNVND